MKKLINTVLLLFLIGTVSSCLKSGLDDLEAIMRLKLLI